MRPRLASIEVHDQLDFAFQKIDETKERLDRLKQAYNEQAKEMEQISYDRLKEVTTPPPPPDENIPPVHVKPPPLPTRYSISTPAVPERPLPPRPRVPRPEPKRVEPPPLPESKGSGRFYIQLTGAEARDEFRDAREKLSRFGRIVDSGRGTASSPKAGWVEVAIRGDASDLVASLRECALTEKVEKVIEVRPGEGRLMARQLDMFRVRSAQK